MKVIKIILNVLYSLLACDLILAMIQEGGFLTNLVLPFFMFAALTVPQLLVYHFAKNENYCYLVELILVITKFIIISFILMCFSNFIFWSSYIQGSSIADFHSHIWDVIIVWVFIVLFICAIIVEITGAVQMLIKYKKRKA